VKDVDLDLLAIHWREALDAAEDSLGAAGRSRPTLPPAELRDRLNGLKDERGRTELELEELARMTNTHLHRHLRGPRAAAPLLGLGAEVRVCVFDLDGVLTASADLHAAAWQETFDELLARHHGSTGEGFGPPRPFGRGDDYVRYIHGRPRIDGVHAFLASRGIRLPDGNPGDPAGMETAYGVARRKNEVLQRRLRDEGMTGYPGSALYLELAHEAGLTCAVVSASANTEEILRRAGLLFLIDEIVDGNTMAADGLKPKPAPDSVLAACRRVGVEPAFAATLETTTAGVAAGRAAGVERVIAVDRGGRAQILAAGGADRVVSDLAELIETSLV
jgi:beta-phosphoglucomutase-like phosphatase (HAD superfamily)